MKLNRKLFSALLVIAMMASMLLPVSAAQMEATYGEASYYDIAVEAYSRMLAFHDGVVGAANQSKKYGLITATGDVRVDFQYDGIWYLADNMFSVKQNGRYGIIDTQGNIIKSITHWEITLIRGAYLRIDGDYFTADRNFTPVSYDEVYGYGDDPYQELAKSLGYDWMYSVGIAVNRYIAGKYTNGVGYSYYLLDGDNSYRVLLTADWMIGILRGSSADLIRILTHDGIYDGNGASIYSAAAHGQRIPEEYNYYYYSGGVIVETNNGSLKGLLDWNGNQIIPCEYQRIGNENGEGYIGAVKANSSGFVDSDIYRADGSRIKTIQNTYVATEVYYRNMAFRTSENGLNGMMDIDGNVLIPNQYTTIDVDSNNNLLALQGDAYYGGTYGLYNQNGRVIFADGYESISSLTYNRYKLRDNGRYGIMDTSGRTVVPFAYVDMRVHTTDFIEVYNGRQYKIIDLDNNTVVRESNNRVELFRPLSYDLGRELSQIYYRYEEWPGELPFCIMTDEGYATVYADPDTGASGGELAHRTSGINEDDMFAYQDDNTNLFGFGKLGKSEYTYEIISPFGVMDEEIGRYTVNYYSDLSDYTIVIDAPVDELAGVYIDDVKLARDSEIDEDSYDEDFYTINTSTGKNQTSITVGMPIPYSIGLHTIAVEFNTADGSVGLRRVTQNFAALPFEFTVLPDGYVGMEYTYELEGSWSNYWLFIPDDDELACIPDGLTFGETTGEITGTPTKAGTWYFTVMGNSGIVGGAPIDYKITIKSPETELPEGVKYVPYSHSFGEAAEVTAGRLPRGLSLDTATGELTGAPLESGNFEFTVRRASSTAVYQMTVANNTNSAVQRPNDYDIIVNVGTQAPYDPNSFYKEDYSEETFAINGPYEEFYRLLIDGVEKLRDVDYTVREGSTIITVRAQTFRNVGEGTHTIAAEFRGKDSSGKATMKQAAQNYTLTIRRPSDNTGSSDSSGSSGSSGSANYSINVPRIPNCTIKVSPTGASEGTRITMTVRPNTGYVLTELTVTGPKGKQIPLNQTDDYKYTFRMPDSKVDIFAEVEAKQPDPVPAGGTPFLDVKETDWFYRDVAEVYAKGWMVGTSKDSFSPREEISRGMIVTILHRIAGKPAAENTYFADVPLNRYYTAAAAWAAEQGIITGYGDGNFGPSDPMTREQIIMVLYNYANLSGVNTGAQSDLSQFKDLDQLSPDAQRAMSWAYSIGLIRGKGDGILDPAGSTTRAETAAFLIRFITLTEN